ncbi:BglG family transcription antiterminator [Bacillus sp. N9]
MLEQEACKLQVLANELGISITTLISYLDELTVWLADFQINITRTRGIGVELSGKEANKRRALAHYFLLYFQEELIESLFLLEKGNRTKATISHYFSAEYLWSIDQVVTDVLSHSQPRLAYSDFVGFIVHTCITMQRTEAGFLLEEAPRDIADFAHEYHLIENISNQLRRVQLTKNDVIYLAIILKGSKFQTVNDLVYDRIDLAQVVKRLMKDVSDQLHIDVTNDFSLYQGLLAHMEPSLFRMKQNMGLFNPLKDEIKRKYPVLFMAVKRFVEREFPDICPFPEDEIAFIVLHFGSALVMWEEKLTIKALIICPTGIGTSKMLASRIKRKSLKSK